MSSRRTVDLNKRYDKDRVLYVLNKKFDDLPFGNVTLGEIIDTLNSIDGKALDLRLVYAAPDLLEAAKEAQKYLRESDNQLIIPCLDKAINKAEGKG